MDSPNVLFAFGLTLVAGPATGIGSGIGVISGMIIMAISLLLFS